MFSFTARRGFRFAKIPTSNIPDEDIHYLKEDFGNLIAGDIALKKDARTKELVIVFPYKIEDKEAVNEKVSKWTSKNNSIPSIK